MLNAAARSSAMRHNDGRNGGRVIRENEYGIEAEGALPLSPANVMILPIRPEARLPALED